MRPANVFVVTLGDHAMNDFQVVGICSDAAKAAAVAKTVGGVVKLYAVDAPLPDHCFASTFECWMASDGTICRERETPVAYVKGSMVPIARKATFAWLRRFFSRAAYHAVSYQSREHAIELCEQLRRQHGAAATRAASV